LENREFYWESECLVNSNDPVPGERRAWDRLSPRT
jgi:hypothetical protein